MTAGLFEGGRQAKGACEFVAFCPELPLDAQVEGCLRAIVQMALARAGGNKCTAAGALQVHRNTLQRYCDRLGINARDFRPGRGKKGPRADGRRDVREVMRRVGARA